MSKAVLYLGYYISEMALMAYELVSTKESLIAASCLYLAMMMLEPGAKWVSNYLGNQFCNFKQTDFVQTIWVDLRIFYSLPLFLWNRLFYIGFVYVYVKDRKLEEDSKYTEKDLKSTVEMLNNMLHNKDPMLVNITNKYSQPWVLYHRIPI